MTTTIRTRQSLAALLTVLAAGALTSVAQAHITVSSETATAGAYARVVLRVPHGCGPSPTTGITVQVPAGYLLAKPMPKPGWTLSVEKAALKPPLRLHGREVSETTAQVRWEGGPLPGEFFDEFVLLGKLDDQAVGPLRFSVLQTCEKGQADWGGEAGSDTPAPVLNVAPAASSPQHTHQH